MNKYNFVEIDNQNLDTLRVIRNSCRQYMTNATDEIFSEQQKEWFKLIDKNKTVVFLMTIEEEEKSVPIGYGLVSFLNDHSILSGGLIEQYRDGGHGRALFEKLIAIGSENDRLVTLAVREDNVRARRLYERLGFKYTTTDNNILWMELER